MYVSHLRLVHQQDPNFHVLCAATGCNKTFRTFPAFNTHVYRLHRDLLGLKPKYDINQDEQTGAEPEGDCVTVSGHMTSDNDEGNDISASSVTGIPFGSVSIDQTVNQLEQSKFLLMLREEKQVSQTAIDTIVEHCRSLCERTHSNVVERVRKLLPHTSASPDDVSRLRTS